MAREIEKRIINSKKPCESATHQKKRVVAYCRVSSLMEEQELSFEAQKSYYQALLGNNPDKKLIHVYGDEGVSGLQASKRPEFQAMIAECRKGNVDEIYTKSVSRFARNYSECLEYARELKGLGICIHFEKEKFTTNDEHVEMYFGLMAILAQEESNSISQAMNWAIDERRKQGDPIQRACYGYKRDKFTTEGVHRWHIVEEEAIRVRIIFFLYMMGNSMKAIVEKMNCYDSENENSKAWTVDRVGYILSNVAYIGELKCGMNYTTDYLSKKSKKNKGERESYYISNHHEPIIPIEDFEYVQKIRKKRGEKNGVHKK